MQTADVNHMDFEQSQQREMDKSLLVKFYLKSVPDSAATAEAGRPMYKEVEYVDIRVVGKKNGGVARPARHSDMDRFPQHYAMFKNRVEAPVEGTPLSEWPPIGRSTVEQLAFMNIKTVEQLAELSDNYASQIMGGNGFKDKAKKFLAYSVEMKEVSDKQELAEENKRLKESVATLTSNLDSLMAKVEKMTAKPATERKKRVRKTPAKKD